MNREIEYSLRDAFADWFRLREELIPHGENEYERERLVRRMEEIADGWSASIYAEEWVYLTKLIEGWRRAPEVMRAASTAAQAGRVPDLAETEIRSLTQVQLLLDPQYAGYEGWQRVQDLLSAHSGRTAAYGADPDPTESTRLSFLTDHDVWPQQWLGYEAEALHEDSWDEHQSRVWAQAYEQARLTVCKAS
ncbi:hypothetical protein [Nocardia cyriacigeorgica]|uniref:hypothetical protein n=1 Tax=Nocardia cyriacigeorgica TaxID=135487 RepID=UPI0034DB5F07